MYFSLFGFFSRLCRSENLSGIINSQDKILCLFLYKKFKFVKEITETKAHYEKYFWELKNLLGKMQARLGLIPVFLKLRISTSVLNLSQRFSL